MTSRRLLLDQVLDEEVAQGLREAGHNAVRVSQVGLATADDAEILRRAVEDDRILVTLDEDFGDWAVLPLANHPGVIREKVNPTTTQLVLSVLVPFLEAAKDRSLRDHLVIARLSGVRWVQTGDS
ncbi:MAG: DUF5615 family PIN-like protein [Bryobacteraceae bacterium]